jgi:hypothetical protein
MIDPRSSTLTIETACLGPIEIQTRLIQSIKRAIYIPFENIYDKQTRDECRAKITLIDGTVLFATTDKIIHSKCRGHWPFKRKWVAFCNEHPMYHEGCIKCQRSFRRYIKLVKLLPKMYPMKKKKMWHGKPNFRY